MLTGKKAHIYQTNRFGLTSSAFKYQTLNKESAQLLTIETLMNLVQENLEHQLTTEKYRITILTERKAILILLPLLLTEYKTNNQ